MLFFSKIRIFIFAPLMEGGSAQITVIIPLVKAVCKVQSSGPVQSHSSSYFKKAFIIKNMSL